MLAYLLVLNRFLLGFKPVYIILALGFLMVQFKSDFRTLIAGALLITVLMVERSFEECSHGHRLAARLSQSSCLVDERSARFFFFLNVLVEVVYFKSRAAFHSMKIL